MSASRSIDQLCRDPDLIVRFTDAAFQHVPHPHLSTHILHLYGSAFVGERRITGDDKETGDRERSVVMSSVMPSLK